MATKHVLTEFPNSGIYVNWGWDGLINKEGFFAQIFFYKNKQDKGGEVSFETTVPKDTPKEAIDILLAALEQKDTILYLRNLYK